MLPRGVSTGRVLHACNLSKEPTRSAAAYPSLCSHDAFILLPAWDTRARPGLPDPCTGTPKRLAVVVSCADGAWGGTFLLLLFLCGLAYLGAYAYVHALRVARRPTVLHTPARWTAPDEMGPVM